MSIVFDGPVPPDALTAFTREVPTPADQILDRILPNRTVASATIDLAEVTRRNRAAKFRAFDGRIVRSSRDSLTTRTIKLPPLSSMNGVGELERLQLEAARSGGNSLAPIVSAIYDDAENLTREVRTRMELARGDVLTDGKFTLAGENGLYLEADFGLPANHKVTASTAWTDLANADVIGQIRGWVQTYVTTNGHRPGGFITSERVLGLMLQNAAVRTLSASLAGSPQLVTEPALAAALSAFRLPPLLFTYDTKVDVDDVTTSVIPDDLFIMVPPNVSDLGYTAWGISATALELVNAAQSDLSFADAPGIVGVVVKSGPPFRQETFVDAVGMPVLEQPKKLFVADVA